MKATLTVVALAMVGAALAARRVLPVRSLRLPDTAYEYANVPLPAHFEGARRRQHARGQPDYERRRHARARR
jgi:hypothetical protein